MNADFTDSRRLKNDFVQAVLQLMHQNLGNYYCFLDPRALRLICVLPRSITADG